MSRQGTRVERRSSSSWRTALCVGGRYSGRARGQRLTWYSPDGRRRGRIAGVSTHCGADLRGLLEEHVEQGEEFLSGGGESGQVATSVHQVEDREVGVQGGLVGSPEGAFRVRAVVQVREVTV
jgi:hypothetical protein